MGQKPHLLVLYGFSTPTSANEHYALYHQFLSGVLGRAQELSVRVTFRTKNKLDSLRAVTDARGVVALVPRSEPGAMRWFRSMERRVPCVRVNQNVPSLQGNYAGIDERAAMELVVGHLAGRGASRLAYLATGLEVYAEERLAAFLEACRRPSAMAEKPVVFTSTDRERVGTFRDFFAAWDKGYRPDAVVCETDFVAEAFARVAMARGIRIPMDLAITGVDDFPVAIPPWGTNALTTLDQGIAEQARAAVGLWHDIHTGLVPAAGQVRLHRPRLRVRETTRRIFHLDVKDDGAFREGVTWVLSESFREDGIDRLMAERLDVAPRTFHRRYARVFGERFLNALHRTRLEWVRKSLLTTETPISHLYGEVGYKSHQAFRYWTGKIYGKRARDLRAMAAKGR